MSNMFCEEDANIISVLKFRFFFLYHVLTSQKATTKSANKMHSTLDAVSTKDAVLPGDDFL